jgi:hypothetical protein
VQRKNNERVGKDGMYKVVRAQPKIEAGSEEATRFDLFNKEKSHAITTQRSMVPTVPNVMPSVTL